MFSNWIKFFIYAYNIVCLFVFLENGKMFYLGMTVGLLSAFVFQDITDMIIWYRLLVRKT